MFGYDERSELTLPLQSLRLRGWERDTGKPGAPLLLPGQTWDGWMTFDEELHRDGEGFTINLKGIRGSEVPWTLAWTYTTPWPP